MKNISIKNIKDPKILSKIEKEISDLDNYGRAIGDIPDKIETMNNLQEVMDLNKNLKNSDLELYQKISDFLVRYKAHFMDLLDEERVLKMFEEHLLLIVKSDIDYEGILRNFLFTKSYKERDSFLEKIREAIEKNREELGDFILVGDKKSRVKGYVKNWLEDYSNFLGKGRHLKIDISNYLFQSPNTKRLNYDQKNYLKKILNFYEKTKIKVNEPFGLGSYPLEWFGIEAVGKEGSIKTKFKTQEGEDLSQVNEFEEATEAPGEDIIPQEQDVISPEAMAKLKSKVEETSASSQGKVPKEITPKSTLPKKEDERVLNEAVVTKPQDEPKQEIKFSMENIDSIAKLSVDIFKKIAASPEQAAEKIKSEAAKLIQGNPENVITAKELWQQSDLYKAYLDIAQEGMNTGLSVDKVIDARKKMGKDTLNKKEFEAVVDLSKVF